MKQGSSSKKTLNKLTSKSTKFKIQNSHIELLINSKKTAPNCIMFSFDQNLLQNAAKILKNITFNPLDDLSEPGNITTIINHNTNQTNIILSLGAKENFNLNKFHSCLKALAHWIIKHKKIKLLDIILEEEIADLLKINQMHYTEQSIFHLISNMYYFDMFKSTRKPLAIDQINFVISSDKNTALNNAIALLEGFFLVKDLGNMPANIATPTYLAKIAHNMTKLSKKVTSEILGKKELKQLGMNCFLAVSDGSDEEPKFITLTYTGTKEKSKPIVLVGKGVTFDSGGISIKPRINMNEMKYDMMGAATVLGTFLTVVKLGLPINLVIAVPCTENLISGSAVKPGDIVTTMSGKTIEIINTDAEGRLILCDALTYIKKFDPALVIDLATLTGACIVALGHIASALYSNDDGLTLALQQSSQRTEDKAWPMPLFDEYEEGLKSSIADMCNIDSWNSYAGSITAAKFLSKFVDYKWAHLDIAGVAFTSGKYDGSSTHKSGATGRPFNLLIDFIRSYKA